MISLLAVPLPDLLPKAAALAPNFVGAKFTSKDCGEAGNCLRLKRPNGKPFLFFFDSDEVVQTLTPQTKDDRVPQTEGYLFNDSFVSGNNPV